MQATPVRALLLLSPNQSGAFISILTAFRLGARSVAGYQEHRVVQLESFFVSGPEIPATGDRPRFLYARGRFGGVFAQVVADHWSARPGWAGD